MERVLSPFKRNIGAAVSSAGFLVVLLALLLDPQTVRESVRSSIGYCLSVLTPSLFPFMALSCYAVNSPAAGFLGRPLEGLTRRVFRLPGCCAVPILMGIIGGYPAGARGASLLLEEGRITREQAGRMLLFCVNPGLAFTVTFLGAGLFGSVRLGWLLFLSVAAPGLLLGVATAIGAPAPEPEAAIGGARPAALVRSVSDSARSVLMMCACIVLFAGFAAILHSLGVFQGAVRMLSRIPVFSPMEWAAVLSFLLEVTGGVGDAARLSVSPTFYAFGLAFGGLCVHMQVFAFFDRLPVKPWRFWLFRLLHGLLAAGCFWGLGRLPLGGAVQAVAPIGGGTAGFSGSIWGGASLLVMCVAFLVIAGEGRQGRSG